MKFKSVVTMLLLVLLVSCGENSSTKNSSSNSSLPTSSTSSISSTESSSSSNTSSSASSVQPLTLKSIQQIRTEAESLTNDTVGQLVKFNATYVKTITLIRSSQDLMYFVDSSSYIYLRIPYTDYTGYLANRDINHEYCVTANITKTNGVVELVLNENMTQQESVVNLSAEISANYEKVAEEKDSISLLVSDYEAIPLDKKKCGTGKIVTITAQLLQTEYTDANKKAVFGDATGIITVISPKKFVDQTVIGKYYQVTGILNIEVTSPALLYLNSKYVAKDNETSLDVSKASDVTPDFLKSKYILQDDYYSPTISQYLTLYKTKGYIVDNTDRNDGKYYLGITTSANGSISDIGKKSIDGLLLMNHYGITENSFSYSPLATPFSNETEITLYFTIHQFNSSEHGWKVFPIESLLD